MIKILNYLIALLLTTMVSCGGSKTQDIPEVMYGCPMPDSTLINEQIENQVAE